jgi:hypothetical protein
MKSLMITLIASSVLMPLLSYGFPMTLNDSQGKAHQANADFMVTENGQPLPDGTYTTPKGKAITVKDGKMSFNQDMMMGPAMKAPAMGGDAGQPSGMGTMGTMQNVPPPPSLPAAAPPAPPAQPASTEPVNDGSTS